MARCRPQIRPSVLLRAGGAAPAGEVQEAAGVTGRVVQAQAQLRAQSPPAAAVRRVVAAAPARALFLLLRRHPR